MGGKARGVFLLSNNNEGCCCKRSSRIFFFSLSHQTWSLLVDVALWVKRTDGKIGLSSVRCRWERFLMCGPGGQKNYYLWHHSSEAVHTPTSGSLTS